MKESIVSTSIRLLRIEIYFSNAANANIFIPKLSKYFSFVVYLTQNVSKVYSQDYIHINKVKG